MPKNPAADAAGSPSEMYLSRREKKLKNRAQGIRRLAFGPMNRADGNIPRLAGFEGRR
jgi:hypothetical protein